MDATKIQTLEDEYGMITRLQAEVRAEWDCTVGRLADLDTARQTCPPMVVHLIDLQIEAERTMSRYLTTRLESLTTRGRTVYETLISELWR